MSMMNATEMDSNVVGIAAFLYIVADLEKTVDHKPDQAYNQVANLIQQSEK